MQIRDTRAVTIEAETIVPNISGSPLPLSYNQRPLVVKVIAWSDESQVFTIYPRKTLTSPARKARECTSAEARNLEASLPLSEGCQALRAMKRRLSRIDTLSLQFV